MLFRLAYVISLAYIDSLCKTNYIVGWVYFDCIRTAWSKIFIWTVFEKEPQFPQYNFITPSRGSRQLYRHFCRLVARVLSKVEEGKRLTVLRESFIRGGRLLFTRWKTTNIRLQEENFHTAPCLWFNSYYPWIIFYLNLINTAQFWKINQLQKINYNLNGISGIIYCVRCELALLTKRSEEYK